VAQDLSPDQLIDLYKIAIEEYRFEVKLNWDRTVFYLTLNSGLIAIATGLLKVEGSSFLNLIVAGVFFMDYASLGLVFAVCKKSTTTIDGQSLRRLCWRTGLVLLGPLNPVGRHWRSARPLGKMNTCKSCTTPRNGYRVHCARVISLG
jgi:hypothetical protein